MRDWAGFATLKLPRQYPMNFTVIIVDGAAIHPVTSLEAETVEAAWEEAQSLYPFADLALVADQDD